MYFRIVDNIAEGGRKTWFHQTYSATIPDSSAPVKQNYESLTDLHGDIYDRLTPSEEMDLTEIEQKSFDDAASCYFCAGKFKRMKDRTKNRDHDHFSG